MGRPTTAMGQAMSKQFRPGDVRRVQAAFDEMMPEGYATEVKLSKDRQHIQVVMMDPEAPDVFIANAQFDYNERALKGADGAFPVHPPEAEMMRIAHEFRQICHGYPAAKAKQEAEQLFKKDFSERKEAKRHEEEVEAQERAEEAAQRVRDKLLVIDEAQAMAGDVESL